MNEWTGDTMGWPGDDAGPVDTAWGQPTPETGEALYTDEAVETGWDPLSAVAGAVGGLADIAAGGPQKRARAAADARKAAEAQLELAKLQATQATPAVYTPPAATAPPPGLFAGLLAKLKSRSPIAGLPWFVVIGAAGLGAYLLFKKRGGRR